MINLRNGFLLGLYLVFSNVGLAQWTSQRISLQPGWNAVFLLVQPEPPDCDVIFSNVSFRVERVHTYNDSFSSVQFVRDPSTLQPEGSEWLKWKPSDDTNRFMVNLFTLDVGTPYLIKLPTNVNPVNWDLIGKSALKQIDWRSHVFNLVGFNFDTNNPPTFAEFFASSPEHSNQPIFRMNSLGAWRQVTNPATTFMRSGEAFWIQTRSASRFQSPIRVEAEQQAGLDFGRTLTEQKLTIYNDSTESRSVQMRLLDSETPPEEAAASPIAGNVPLVWYHPNGSNLWERLINEVTLTNIPSQDRVIVRLAVRRKDMTPNATTNAVYQSLLEVADLDGSTRCLVPVTALGLETFDAAGNPIDPYTGLWVGSVKLNQVSYPTAITNDPTAANYNASPNPLPTPAEFSFRLLVHADTNGQASLLQKVLLMWRGETNGSSGHYVLVTDDSKIPRFQDATLKAGDYTARRISTAAFAFDQPLPLIGIGNRFGTGTLSCVVNMEYTNKLNPFVHSYHPDHDNIKPGQEGGTYGEGVESYTYDRNISMEFTENDPENLDSADWGDSQIGGIWRETITGLCRTSTPLYVQGVFRLQRANRIGALNDGM